MEIDCDGQSVSNALHWRDELKHYGFGISTVKNIESKLMHMNY
jgi:hypothetical protein